MSERVVSWSASCRTFAILMGFLVLNALWCFAAHALGWEYPFDSFLSDPSDRFGDFVKVALSYPDARPIPLGDLLGLRAHVVAHMLTGYDPRSPLLTRHAFPLITHFHLTPFTTLLALIAGGAMRSVEPAIVLLIASLALAVYAARVCWLAGRDTRERLFWFAAMMVSYPMLFALDRGNLFAGLAGLALIHALLLARQGGSACIIALLFAIALNIRPNAVPFVLLAVMWDWRRAVPLLLGTGSATAAVGLLSLVAAHALYPPYTPVSFVAGLARYYLLYVVGDDGLAGGSSLLGAGKLLFGYRVGLDRATGIVGLAIIVSALILHRRLDRSSSAFLVAAGTALGSAVFADYHLLVFFIVPIAWALELQPGQPARSITERKLALLLSWSILVPKNFLHEGAVSLQVVVNPLLLLAGSIALIVIALSATKKRSDPFPDRSFHSEQSSLA